MRRLITLLFFATLFMGANAQTTILEDNFDSYTTDVNIVGTNGFMIGLNSDPIGSTAATAVIKDGVGVNGSKAVLVTPVSSETNTIFYQQLNLTPGNKYVISISMIRTDAAYTKAMNFFANPTNGQSGVWAGGFVTHDWTESAASVEITVEPLAEQTEWVIAAYSYSSQAFYVDNIKITEEQGSEPVNGAIIPVPYDRDDAWTNWKEARVQEVQDRIDALTNPTKVKVAFVGNSITWAWLDAARGLPLWNEHFAAESTPYYAVNLAVPGDRTENVLYRFINKIDGGEYGHLDNTDIDPAVTVLMIGTNNTFSYTAEQISEGVEAVVNRIKELRPNTHIVLCSILPQFDQTTREETKIKPANLASQTLADSDPNITYLDLYTLFTNQDGTQNAELFRFEDIHPNDAGYVVWFDALKPILDNLFVTTAISETKDNTFSVSPNPNQGCFQVKSKEVINQWSIYTITGSLIKTQNVLNANTFNINLPNATPGIYLMKTTSQSGIHMVKRFVID